MQRSGLSVPRRRIDAEAVVFDGTQSVPRDWPAEDGLESAHFSDAVQGILHKMAGRVFVDRGYGENCKRMGSPLVLDYLVLAKIEPVAPARQRS